MLCIIENIGTRDSISESIYCYRAPQKAGTHGYHPYDTYADRFPPLTLFRSVAIFHGAHRLLNAQNQYVLEDRRLGNHPIHRLRR